MTISKLIVLVNREGGAAAAAGDTLADDILAALDAVGVAADVRMLAGAEMSAAIAEAAKTHKRIVVAGGDGTMSSAAQILAGGDTELALLPLGTLNHLARDLGIPADLIQAAAVAARGEPIDIDIGEVNGQRFVNNASIGLYPSMVKGRDAYRERRGLPKWLASIPASWEALSRLRHHRLRIDMGEGEQPLITPLLFVGNNPYSLDAGSVGSRSSLQDGTLAVYAVASRRRMALIWFAMRAVVGKVDRQNDFVALGESPTTTVCAPSGSVEIALDGEVQRLPSPLLFRTEAKALRVVVPAAQE